MSYLTRNQTKKLLKNCFLKPRSTNFFTPQLHNWPNLLRRWLLKKDLSLCFTSTSRFLLFLLNFLSILHDFFVFIRSRLINKLMLAICVTQCCGKFFSYFLTVLGYRLFPINFQDFHLNGTYLILIKCADYFKLFIAILKRIKM